MARPLSAEDATVISLEVIWFAMWRAAIVVFFLVLVGVVPPPWEDE